MKRIVILFLALFTVTTGAYAIESQFPGGATAGETPQDIDTQPPKYYPPQQEIPNQTDLPSDNSQQQQQQQQ